MNWHLSCNGVDQPHNPCRAIEKKSFSNTGEKTRKNQTKTKQQRVMSKSGVCSPHWPPRTQHTELFLTTARSLEGRTSERRTHTRTGQVFYFSIGTCVCVKLRPFPHARAQDEAPGWARGVFRESADRRTAFPPTQGRPLRLRLRLPSSSSSSSPFVSIFSLSLFLFLLCCLISSVSVLIPACLSSVISSLAKFVRVALSTLHNNNNNNNDLDNLQYLRHEKKK